MKVLRQIYLNANSNVVELVLPIVPKKMKIVQYSIDLGTDADSHNNKLFWREENQDLLLINTLISSGVYNITYDTKIECDIQDWNKRMSLDIITSAGAIAAFTNPTISLLVEFSN